MRETQRAELVDDQRADQLPGDDGRKEKRGSQAADQEHGRQHECAQQRAGPTHQRVPLNCAAAGHFERTATWKSNRLAADTKADNIEAQREPLRRALPSSG
jgi:hypothetical protein